MISLKNLKDATAQAVFDQIVNHLRAQGEPCKDESGVCSYKSGNERCAAGCLISDDEYNKEYEGKGWDSLVSESKVTKMHKDLICAMQNIHDCDPIRVWEESFYEVAVRFSLVYTPA